MGGTTISQLTGSSRLVAEIVNGETSDNDIADVHEVESIGFGVIPGENHLVVMAEPDQAYAVVHAA